MKKLLILALLITTTDGKQLEFNCENIQTIRDLGSRREVLLENQSQIIFTYEAESYLTFKLNKCLKALQTE